MSVTLDSAGVSAKRETAEAVRRASPLIVALARVGFAAKGLIYAVVGALAVQVAAGTGGRLTDSRGVFRTIAGTTTGDILLVALGVGLSGYGLWRLVQAALDPERKGSDAKGLARRVGYAASGVFHLVLGGTAVFIATRTPQIGPVGARTTSPQATTAHFMNAPFGPWLVGAAGAAFVGFAVWEFVRAYRADFQKKLDLSWVSARVRHLAVRSGQVGHAARGVVAGVVGACLVQAARRHDPSQARGLGGALAELARAPHGRALLAVVAAGLFAYGVFKAIEAAFRRITPA